MNLSKLATIFGKAAVITRDLNALQRGRFAERLANRAMGRMVNNATRNIWR